MGKPSPRGFDRPDRSWPKLSMNELAVWAPGLATSGLDLDGSPNLRLPLNIERSSVSETPILSCKSSSAYMAHIDCNIVKDEVVILPPWKEIRAYWHAEGVGRHQTTRLPGREGWAFRRPLPAMAFGREG